MGLVDALRLYWWLVVSLRFYWGLLVALRFYMELTVALRFYFGLVVTLRFYGGFYSWGLIREATKLKEPYFLPNMATNLLKDYDFANIVSMDILICRPK